MTAASSLASLDFLLSCVLNRDLGAPVSRQVQVLVVLAEDPGLTARGSPL